MITKLRPKYRVIYALCVLYGSVYKGVDRVEGELPSFLDRAYEAIQIIGKGCCYAYPRQS